MAKYSIRDALRPPGLLSLARLPLGVSFIFAVGHPAWATTVIGAAAVSDVFDGWLARHRHEETPIGAVLDAVMDKVFVLIVVASFFVHGSITIPEAILLGTRDIGELPLACRLALQRDPSARAERRANIPGKVATVAQFAAVLALIWGAPHRQAWIAVAALAGIAAAISYWVRERTPSRLT